jgi:Right handed beta helix region
MLEILDPLQVLVIGAIGTVVGMFLRPLAERFVERIFLRKPAFAFRPIIIRDSWTLDVEPLNSTASKPKPLSISFDGWIVRDVGKLQDKRAIRWHIDLSEIEGLSEHLKANGRVEIQFFFDADRMSEKMKIGFAGNDDSPPVSSEGRRSVTVNSVDDFIKGVGSDRRIVIKNSEINVTGGFPLISESALWEAVFDGKELHIANLADVEFIGIDSKLMAEPRYAWVLHFRHCYNIAIRNLIVGHLSSGYCQGGVIKFESCRGIRIENCDLYGSGTYGLEFSNCEEIEVVSTQIHECTYGILQMRDCTNALFSNCRFYQNKEFELCTFAGKIDAVTFRGCTFDQNTSRYNLFSLKGINEPGLGVEVWDSIFNKNTCPQLVDDRQFFSEIDNRYFDNQWAQDSPEL